MKNSWCWSIHQLAVDLLCGGWFSLAVPNTSFSTWAMSMFFSFIAFCTHNQIQTIKFQLHQVQLNHWLTILLGRIAMWPIASTVAWSVCVSVGHRTLQFIPTIRNTWKEEGWTHPLNRKLREYISKKHRLWTRYLETRDNAVLKNINQSEIELKMKFVNYKKRNNKMSLCIANKIQRLSGSILIANVKLKLALVIYIL